MVLLHPVKGVADQEILYFIFAVVKHLGAPVRVFALAGVSVFEQGLSVKISQSMGVLGEMGRNPVQDDADSGAVEIIHKIHEVLWRAVPGGGCKISGYLITPGTVKWMFCDAHQFNMGITHLLHIGRQFMGRLGVCIEPVLFFPVFLAPRTKVYLVNAHGKLLHILGGTLGDPVAVRPVKTLNIRGHGSSTRPVFGAECKWVGFVEYLAGFGGDGEFIKLAHLHACIEILPYAGIRYLNHGIGLRIPAVKIPHQVHFPGVGGPDRKIDAVLSLVCPGMGAQFLINIIVCPGSEQITVQVGDISRGPGLFLFGPGICCGRGFRICPGFCTRIAFVYSHISSPPLVLGQRPGCPLILYGPFRRTQAGRLRRIHPPAGSPPPWPGLVQVHQSPPHCHHCLPR